MLRSINNECLWVTLNAFWERGTIHSFSFYIPNTWKVEMNAHFTGEKEEAGSI